MSNTTPAIPDQTPQAFYMVYRPTRMQRFWKWAGFKPAFVLPEETPPEGCIQSNITTTIDLRFSWLDILRLMVTRRASVFIRTYTDVEVAVATSVSVFEVSPPGEAT